MDVGVVGSLGPIITDKVSTLITSIVSLLNLKSNLQRRLLAKTVFI